MGPGFVLQHDRDEPLQSALYQCPLMEVKQQAAMRWVNAVQAEGSYGRWYYAMARKPEDVRTRIEETALLE